MGHRALIWTTHLRTVIWLSWRLWQRRWKRQGSGYRGLGSIVAVVAVLAGSLSFLLSLVLGWALLPPAGPDTVLLTWAGLIVVFVFVRVLGAFADLQHGDGLRLDNLLHLPFSLHQVFLLNFALSQLNLTTVIFVPALLGLAIACTAALDVRNFVLIPASLSLVLCVAAVMYQLQGWITSAAGSRRRQALIGYLVVTVLAGVGQVSYLLFLTQRMGSGPDMTREAFWFLGEWLSSGWVTHGPAEGSDRWPWLSVIAMGRTPHDHGSEPPGRLPGHPRPVPARSDGQRASTSGGAGTGAACPGATGVGVTRSGHRPGHAQALVSFHARLGGVFGPVGDSGLVRVPLVSRFR